MDAGLYPKKIEEHFGLRLNKNQTLQIKRLIHEIIKAKKIPFVKTVALIKEELRGKKPQGKDKFHHIKKILVELRYPLTSTKINIDTRKVFLDKLKKPQSKTYHPREEFIPKKVIVENEVKDSYLAGAVRRHFPKVRFEYIEYYSHFLKKHRLSPYNLKQPLLFIVKERWDFIKRCPCTKDHIGCGYWIFNLGFGCPFDCSYCYLQQYQNFPGIILPSNLDDFFSRFDAFFKKINRPIRIGTGEFCDSLALDHITGYSTRLIKYFSKRPVLFELKTKSAKIENVLKEKPSKNIVISWSLNPQKSIDSQEYGTAPLRERLKAAGKVQQRGFGIAFHFDPIIYSDDWQKEYKKLIETLYAKVHPPFAWISLGTLRFGRRLKSFMEQRFPDSDLAYGELFLGDDKKLRYPEFLRVDIYKNVVQWIKRFDKKTPLYLCMESSRVWKESLAEVSSDREVEDSLIKNNA